MRTASYSYLKREEQKTTIVEKHGRRLLQQLLILLLERHRDPAERKKNIIAFRIHHCIHPLFPISIKIYLQQ